MLYVDPGSCVDCGACVTACPVDAIKPHTTLSERELPFIALNAAYFEGSPHRDRSTLAPIPKRREPTLIEPVRVAIVGAGPAALYAADALLRYPGVEVDVFDRLPTPYGLVRAGVAPDHQHTKRVSRLFEQIENQPGFHYLLNVDVGEHVSHEDLAAHYHGVIYAVGASADRSLGVPGEELPGSESATSVVGWYNGHPDHVDTRVDLGVDRVVVVGNGNVALDVARVLTADPADLACTDIAAPALAALRAGEVREVVVLGRRGPEHAAFTVPELIGLAGLEGIDVLVDNGGAPIEVTSRKTEILAELAAREPRTGHRRIVLRFRTVPVEVLGEERVVAVAVRRTELVPDDDGVPRAVPLGQVEVIDTGMVLRSVGYRGVPVAGLPFDEMTATVPNDRGRVARGVYVAGWIKRGPNGFIGTNKTCAEETVDQFLHDLETGVLAAPVGTRSQLHRIVREAQPEVVDLKGWRAIDRAERERGLAVGRVREKSIDVDELARLARLGAGRGSSRGRRFAGMRPFGRGEEP